MNHGAGKNKALDNTKEHAEKMIKTYAGEKGLKDFRGIVGDTVNQEVLF